METSKRTREAHPGPAFVALALALALAVAACAPQGSAPGAEGEAAPDPAVRGAAGAAAAGRPVVSPVRRPEEAEAPLYACSFALPLCAHAPAGAQPGAILAVLAEAERALRVYDALSLPRPLPDDDRGGGPSYDLYLAADVPPLAPRVGQDLPALGEPRDASSAFAVLAAPGPGAEASCATGSDVAYALGHAVAARLDAGASEGELAMAASYLAALAAPCPAAELAAVDAFQRAPERSITAGELGARDGALLFPWYLDEAHGAGQPAGVMLGLLAVAGQRTPPGALRYGNEPDIFDALRASLRARDRALDALLLDFAVTRAFVDGSRSRSAGVHLADAARLGGFGRVRLEWSIPFDTLPRRVAPLRPIEPTGATYVWLDLAAAAVTDAREVTFVADWEVGALFRWALVKVGPGGGEVGRVDVAGIYGETRAQRTVVGLEGLAGLLVVGVNAGSDDRSRPFDPDDAPHAPRGYTVWLSR